MDTFYKPIEFVSLIPMSGAISNASNHACSIDPRSSRRAICCRSHAPRGLQRT